MLILLPPSEGKTSPLDGPPATLETLSFHTQLAAARTQAWRAQPIAVRRSPTSPAHKVYSGVLYAALDYPSLNAASKRRADSHIIVISALFGALRLTDAIPAYKATMSNSIWRVPVTSALTELKSRLVIDCRSGAYQGCYAPAQDNTVAVRIFKEVRGKRTVITHMSKHYRGLVARHLVQVTRRPRTPQEVAAIVSTQLRCELTEPSTNQSWLLDVIVES